MARREKKGEEGGYSYMDTYGDMVTLLLTFFVLLFAFSSMDDNKWKSVVVAFTGAPPRTAIVAMDLLDQPNFSEFMPGAADGIKALLEAASGKADDDRKTVSLPTLGTGEMVDVAVKDLQNGYVMVVDPVTQEVLGSPEYLEVLKGFDELYRELTSYVQMEGVGDMLYVERDSDSIHLRVKAGVLFKSGRAELQEDYLPILDELEAVIAKSRESIGFIQVEGHTDDVPIAKSNPAYQDNWQLSCDRAINVVRYFVSKGNISPQAILGVGYGEYSPIALNDSEENRQLNRRVQIVLKRRELTIEEIQREDLSVDPPILPQSTPGQDTSESPWSNLNEQEESTP